MTNEEIRDNLAQAKALRNNIAPAGNSPLTMTLRNELVDEVERALLDPSVTTFNVAYYPLKKYSAIATLPKSEIEKMLGDYILTYVTLENAELRLRLINNTTTKYLVLFFKVK